MLRAALRASHLSSGASVLLGCTVRPSCTRTVMTSTQWIPNQYPKSHRSDHVDVYKSDKQTSVRVHDPYQWLENNSTDTNRWTAEQDNLTRHYLSQNPDRATLEREIRANMDYEKVFAPSRGYDGRWYWFYNRGLQAQSVLYRSKGPNLPDLSKETSDVEVFFDPNLLSEDGTVAMTTSAISRSGEYFAYGISKSGSDVFTIYIRRTTEPFASGQLADHDATRLNEEIRNVKFSGITWTHDSEGFFYQRYPVRESHGEESEIQTSNDRDAMLYYHKIGTPQADDILIMKRPDDPEWMWHVSVSELDGRYLYLSISKDTSTKNLLWVADLKNDKIGPDMKWRRLIDEFDAQYEVVANDESKLYIHTNEGAPNYKLSTLDLADPKGERKDLIPERDDAYLYDVTAVGRNYFAVVYKRNVIDEVHLYTMTGEYHQRIASEYVGAADVVGRRSLSNFFVTLTGFTNPGIIGRYNFDEPNEKWSVYRTTDVKGLNAKEFEVEQVWYESKDGTKIPMFIVRHESTKRDGTAPTIQYGYGGFSIPVNPSFNPPVLTFLKSYGAVYAVPNIRGGGEFGEKWHEAGIREKKINGFEDFISATDYLVKNKVAAPGKVAINGGSNGGLLVAACVNLAPGNTFGAAVAEVGVLDLLKFADFTIGSAWVSDYGDPHDPKDFDFIYPISPLHNVPADKVLPPFLLMTADHDNRVVPLHSFKHAATLQHTLPNNPHPFLIRIDKKAGHGAGKGTEKRIQDATDKWGFVAQSMGLKMRD